MSYRIVMPAALIIALLSGMASPSRAADAQFDVPKLEKVSIDGDAKDWGDAGLRVDALPDGSDRVRPRSNFDASFRLAWDDRGLLLLATVTDNFFTEDASGEQMWTKDSLELFVGKEAGKPNMLWQAVVSPGMAPETPDLRFHLYDHRGKADENAALKFEAKRTKLDHGYVLEALLPWDNLAITPEVGKTVAFQIYINDVDAMTRSQAIWFPQQGAPYVSKYMYTIRLADKPSDPVKAAAWGKYERFRRTRINVLATADLADKTVSIKDGEKEIGAGTLSANDGRATASIACPMPPAGKPYGPLSVLVDGKPINTVTLGDPEDQRHEEFAQAKVVFKPPVLRGAGFSTFDFADPSHVEDLIGPYTLTATYYDAEYNVVERAEKPGRYGAVIDVAAEDGTHYHKFVTLFRSPKPVNTWSHKFVAEFTLPDDLGIDPQVVKNQTPVISEMYRWDFADSSEHPSERAALIAGLYETKPTDRVGTRFDDLMQRDYAWWYTLKKKLNLAPKMAYLAYTPEGYDEKDAKKWPVLIALHGGGANGEDAAKLKPYGMPGLAERKKFNQPMILLAPMCVRGESWHAEMLNDFLDDMMTKFHIDPDRVYVTGGSMGGMGAYDWAIASPERIAAVAPLCGMADASDAERIKDIPFWVFHGDKDRSVFIDPDLKMFARMKELGGRMRMTIFLNGPHGIEAPSYQPELFDWMLQQSRGKPQQGPATQPVEVPFGN